MKKLIITALFAVVFTATSCKKEPEPTLVRFIDNDMSPYCKGTCTMAKFYINSVEKTHTKDYVAYTGDVIEMISQGYDTLQYFIDDPKGFVYRVDTFIAGPINLTLRLRLPDGNLKEISYKGTEDYHLRYIIE